MKTSAVAAVLLTGIGIGGFSVHSLQAQTQPPVYMIEDNTVRDPEGFAKEFAPLARGSLKTYGGRYLGGGSGISIDGDPPKGRVVLVRCRCQGISTANPEIVKAYAGLSHANTKSARIDAKTRELLALAVAVTLRCDGCTNAHTDDKFELHR